MIPFTLSQTTRNLNGGDTCTLDRSLMLSLSFSITKHFPQDVILGRHRQGCFKTLFSMKASERTEHGRALRHSSPGCSPMNSDTVLNTPMLPKALAAGPWRQAPSDKALEGNRKH